MTRLRRSIAQGATIAIVVLLVACAGGPAAQSLTPTPVGSVGLSPSVGSVVPASCDAIPAAALATLLGGSAKLDVEASDKQTYQLACAWFNDASGVGHVGAQASASADSFVNKVASQEGTGSSEYQSVPGFDEARLYASGGHLGYSHFIARNGDAAVWLQLSDIYPDPTIDQIAAVAHLFVH